MYTDHQGTDDQCALVISVASAVPPVSVHQCLVSLLISATSMPHISAHLSCLSVSPFSATYQCCQSVPPMSASQCRLSMCISATYQCLSVPPISAMYQ
ncbi:unnamed protein product, partial [Staurois parvus]